MVSAYQGFYKKEFRESSVSATFRQQKPGNRAFFMLIFFYLLTGLIFVPVMLTNPNIFMSGTLLITYTMFMIGSLILIEYHTVVTSPEEYLNLGFRPISSRTFFFVKVANLSFYVLTFTCVLALPAIITLACAKFHNILISIAAFWGVLLANIAVTFAIILLYTLILKKASMQKLQNSLSIFQVGLAFFIYSGFYIIPRIMEKSQLLDLTLSAKPLLALLPSTWFSSFLVIASGDATTIHWLLALLAICVLLMLGVFSLSNLTMDYSESLATIAIQATSRKASHKRFSRLFFLFTNAHEERVIARLIRNQFLHDNKFKMAVLGILPLTVFYLFLSTQNGALANPFMTPEVDMGKTGLLYLLVFLFPMMLRTYVSQSDSYQASWIFYTTPTRIWRLIAAEKNFLMIYFVLPFLVILGGIFYYYFNNVLHALLHILLLGLLAHFFLQIAFLYSPDLPFSRPNIKGQRTRNITLLLLLVPFVLYLGLPLIFKFVYPEFSTFFVFAAMVLIVSLTLESLIKVRVSHYMNRFEFPG